VGTETVFVITPIGPGDSDVRRRADDLLDLVIRPVLDSINEERGSALQAVRADLMDRPGSITDGIVEHILSSRVVVVDLAGLNPNVLYEMGIADSFGIPTVRLSDDLASLPFDTKDHNAIELVSAAGGALLGRDVEACKAALRAQVQHTLAGTFVPTSIVVRHAKVARLDALTASLDSGDAQDKALAAVLEKFADLEARLDQIGDPYFKPGSLAKDALLGQVPIRVLILMDALLDVGPVPAGIWNSAVESSEYLRESEMLARDHGYIHLRIGPAGAEVALAHAESKVRDALKGLMTGTAVRAKVHEIVRVIEDAAIGSSSASPPSD
jgi:hypothetical protein